MIQYLNITEDDIESSRNFLVLKKILVLKKKERKKKENVNRWNFLSLSKKIDDRQNFLSLQRDR